MGFLPEHVNPVLLTLAGMGLAALFDRRRWWLVGLPALLALVVGSMVDATGASVRDVPLVPFVVEAATIVIFGGLAFRRHIESTL